MNEVLKYLLAEQEDMLACLKNLVEHETPTNGSKTDNDEFAKMLGKKFEELTGGKSEVLYNSAGYGNHLMAEFGDGEEQILVLCHYDTVWPKTTIVAKPFKIEDGKAYGPGIYDMKAGIMQGLFAVKALKELGRKLNKKVVFLFTSDEEVGSPSSRGLIEQQARKSKCVLVLEPSASDNGKPIGALKTARKGVGFFDIKVKGIAAHAGSAHKDGRSAIGEMAKQVDYIHSLTDHNEGLTLNVGVIKGGTETNVVAAECLASVDVRVWTKEQGDMITFQLLNLQPLTPDVKIEVKGGINRPPMERTADVVQMYELAKNIATTELGMADLPEMAVGGGSDGNFTCTIAPTLDGLGAVGDGAHAAHEYIVVAEIPKRAALVALLLEKLANQ